MSVTVTFGTKELLTTFASIKANAAGAFIGSFNLGPLRLRQAHPDNKNDKTITPNKH
jgi:hypothetical protein